LSKFGKIAKKQFENIHDRYLNCKIDCYVIMPNHVHFILCITNDGRENPAPTVSQIIGYDKYQTAKQFNVPGFWQRSFHDHIIRNEAAYLHIWQYIENNPALWIQDCYYTQPEESK